MSELLPHQKLVFGVSPEGQGDGVPLLLIGVPDGAWKYMGRGKTHHLDLTSIGISIKLMLFADDRRTQSPCRSPDSAPARPRLRHQAKEREQTEMTHWPEDLARREAAFDELDADRLAAGGSISLDRQSHPPRRWYRWGAGVLSVAVVTLAIGIGAGVLAWLAVYGWRMLG